MPRMRCARRSGWNGSRPSVRSPVPRNATGRPVAARMLSAAPPRASPSIFVSTRPVTGSLAVEGLRHADRLLAGHRVDHEQRLGRRHGADDADELVHHRLVDVEPAGGVEDHHVDAPLPRDLEAGARHLQRRRADRAGVDLDPDLIAELHELVDRGGPVDVGGHQQRAACRPCAAGPPAWRRSSSCPSPGGRPSSAPPAWRRAGAGGAHRRAPPRAPRGRS